MRVDNLPFAFFHLNHRNVFFANRILLFEPSNSFFAITNTITAGLPPFYRELNGTSQVAALDILGVQQDLLQGTGCHQLIKLVIRKGENIGSCLGVSQNGILGTGLGLDTDLDRNVALVGILRDESIGHLTQHGLDRKSVV